MQVCLSSTSNVHCCGRRSLTGKTVYMRQHHPHHITFFGVGKGLPVHGADCEMVDKQGYHKTVLPLPLEVLCNDTSGFGDESPAGFLSPGSFISSIPTRVTSSMTDRSEHDILHCNCTRTFGDECFPQPR